MKPKEYKPVKVGIVVGKMVGGGVESVVLNLLKFNDSETYTIDFIVDSDSTNVPLELIRSLGGHVKYIPPYQNVIKYQKALNRLFKKENYQIVHANISALNVFPMFAAYMCHVPVRIAHNHNLISPSDGIKKNIIKKFLSFFNTIFPNVYISPTQKSGSWVFRHKKFKVVKNGIDSKRFEFSNKNRKQIRDDLKIRDSQILMGSFCRFVNYKRIPFALTVFEKLVLYNPNFRFLLVGDGPMKTEIYKQISGSPILSTAVIVLDSKSDIEKYYSALDCYIFPSSMEAFGMTAVEAQTNGLLTFVSSGIPIEAKISQKLFKVILGDNVDYWCKSILKSIKNAPDRSAISNSVSKNDILSSKKMTKKVEQIYKSALVEFHS